MGRLLAGCVWKDAIGGKPPPTWGPQCLYIMCLTQDQCGRGLAPVQTGDIVYISNRGHGLQVNTHDQEVTDHALEPRVPHESKNQAGS